MSDQLSGKELFRTWAEEHIDPKDRVLYENAMGAFVAGLELGRGEGSELAEWGMNQTGFEDDEPIQTMFGLTYANYLVLHRSLLQSMPVPWQRRFAGLLGEFEAAFFETPRALRYRVNAIDDRGRFMREPVPQYDRGRTRIAIPERTTEAGL